MPRHVTLTEIRARHQREIKRLVLGALERNGWRLTAAAEQLGVNASTVQSLIETHGLGELYAERRHKPGRPRAMELEPTPVMPRSKDE